MSTPLSPDEWSSLEALVDRLLDAPPEQRRALLTELSGGDPVRRAALEEIAAECDRSHPLLDRPAAERFAAMMVDDDSAVPELLADRYRISKQLGRGGMARVYLARDLKHGRDVAVKVVRPDVAAAVGHGRFLREIELAAQLTHPHIVPLYDSGEAAWQSGVHKGQPLLYYVMPYLEGHSLRHRLERAGPLPVDDAIGVLRDVADALAYAHERGIVHRDIKPDNVLLVGRHAVVVDFGVARALTKAASNAAFTTTDVAVGTPTYMSPEQAAADPGLDHRADIYAFGVLAYELLTGEPPFVGATAQAVLSAHLAATPQILAARLPAMPANLAMLVMKCLQKNPADRWQRADEILEALQRVSIAGDQIAPASTRRVSWRWITTVAAGLVIAAVATVVTLKMKQGPALDPSRIAVVRFRNLTGIDSLDVLGAVIADMITNGLSRSEAVSVAPAAVVMGSAASRLDSTGSFDLKSLAAEARAALVVTGTYRLRGDSLSLSAEIVDVRRNRHLSPLDVVTVPIAEQERGIATLLERVRVALAASGDPRLATVAPFSTLPMSMDAYGEYVTGLEKLGSGQDGHGLAHFYRAIQLDSSAGSAYLYAALAEWIETFNLPKVDSLLRIVDRDRHRSELRSFDVAQLDWLRAWLDGDLEAAVQAAARRAEVGGVLQMGVAQAAIRVNRLDYAYDRINTALASPWTREAITTWQFLTHILHARGDYGRELSEAERAAAAMREPVSKATVQDLKSLKIRALAALGRSTELRAELEDLRVVAPTSPAYHDAASELRWHGYSAAADDIGRVAADWYRAALRRSATRDVRVLLARTLFELGEWNEARSLFEQLARDSLPSTFGNEHWLALDVVPLGYLGIDAARRGDATAAEAMIGRLEKIDRPYLLGAHVHWQARIAARLGDCSRSVAFLREAFRRGSSAFYTAWSFGLEVPEFATLNGCRAYEEFRRVKR